MILLETERSCPHEQSQTILPCRPVILTQRRIHGGVILSKMLDDSGKNS
jgi:hypothetical protein